MEFDTQTIVALVSGVTTCLTGAIVYLFKMVLDLNRAQTRMSLELGEVRGQQKGVTQMSKQVLDVLYRSVAADKIPTHDLEKLVERFDDN